jgi:hypothetical protein
MASIAVDLTSDDPDVVVPEDSSTAELEQQLQLVDEELLDVSCQCLFNMACTMRSN